MLKFLNVMKMEEDFAIKTQSVNAAILRKMGYSRAMIPLFVAINAPGADKLDETLKADTMEMRTVN
jgi:hypothetical protein